jgi:predicted Zn-dependent protease
MGDLAGLPQDRSHRRTGAVKGATIMKLKLIFAAAAALACSVPTVAVAQSQPGAIVTLYRAAPGQQVALLRWLAQRDQIAAATGVAKSQLYVHTNGDSWDYMIIAPQTTEAQDAAQDAAAKKMGATTGPSAGIELRRFITYHTDTLVNGPTTAGEFLSKIGDK